MPQHLKMFERLSYGALALGVVSALLARPATAEIVGIVIVALIVGALIWAAARKGQVWAAWVLVVLTILSIIVVVVIFAGGRTPQWLSWLRPETTPTTLEKTLDVVTTIMEVAGLYFYFFGSRQAASQA